MATLLAAVGGSSGPPVADRGVAPGPALRVDATAASLTRCTFDDTGVQGIGLAATGLPYGSGFEARLRMRSGAARPQSPPADGPAPAHDPAPGAAGDESAWPAMRPGADPRARASAPGIK
jgi:hypothetical protein